MSTPYKNFIITEKQLLILSFLLYLSLLLGFLFGEDSTGGAFLDYKNQKNIVNLFTINFTDTLLNYDNYNTRHSPVLLIILSFFESLKFSDSVIRLIYLHFNLILPFLFYSILKIKFKTCEHLNVLCFLLIGILFISPTFRSLSIWPDSRLVGLTFFVLSIYFYI